MSDQPAEQRAGEGRRPRPRRSWRGVLGRAALLVCSCLAALALAETICRQWVRLGTFHWQDALPGVSWSIDDEQLGYVPRPGYRGRLESPEFSHAVAINEAGFRGGETGDAPAVWVLGDSFAFGVGVEQELSLPARLEQIRQQAGHPEPVWNLGIPSHASQQYRLLLERHLQGGAEPVAVVVLFYLGEVPSGANDLSTAVDFEQEAAAAASVTPASPSPPRTAALRPEPAPGRSRAGDRLRRWLHRHSALYNFLLIRVGGQIRAWRDAGRPADPGQRATIEEGWRILRRELGALEGLAAAHGFPLLAVYVPELTDVVRGRPDFGRRFSGLAMEAGVPALDLLPVFVAEGDHDALYFQLDGHLRPRGNDVAARATAAAMGSAAR